MLRSTGVSLYYRATAELDRLRGMLRGRARLERKVGLKRITFLMRTQTRYRVEHKAHWERAIVRKNVDSAAHEHGSGWQHLRNDLARQNLMLLPRTQQQLAQYEPLAFRAVMELCASRVAPPPPPMTAQVPEEAYATRPEDPKVAHPAARRQLKECIEHMLCTGRSEVLQREGPRTTQAWMDAWKEYDLGSAAQK
ncbi:mitoribosomal protein bL20m [Leishmania donovani]|uniref:Hypothetical_protein_conserved n=1 Tax=Leishmania donovani TaxID=5661 RepID=A0A3S7XB97_LEIDO|nr:hypothetical protein, conserved [Leishmania donovani]AYU83695.1 hypothetical protein LdCL_360041000 [Leishmania donovani]TPP42111.1 hypothetical protein CGC20_28265 [Leishmania donovani]TPP48449.1 hypothetical protein CGC21_13995 [Leishmania donovani]CAJ1993713.1 mitoribosomal protein bL20m [Leishmania donovani]CBZ38780.1 hypothetical protein, conserved [Leishmania donovani]